MIGNRDRLGIIAAGVVGVRRHVAQARKTREVARRRFDESLDKVAPTTIDADDDDIFDPRQSPRLGRERNEEKQREKVTGFQVRRFAGTLMRGADRVASMQERDWEEVLLGQRARRPKLSRRCAVFTIGRRALDLLLPIAD